MSKLSNLLERAFENKGNKNRYSDGQWSIGFKERVWDTYFELYYNNVPVMEGNTLDKELKLCNGSVCPIEKLIPEIEKALPEYRFDIHLSLMVPVDFNGHSIYEVENADYVKTAEEVRFEDTTNGYGYDVDVYSVTHIADLNNVVIIDEVGKRFAIDETEVRLGTNGEVDICPMVLVPLEVKDKYAAAVKHYSTEHGTDIDQASQNAKDRVSSLDERIESASLRASEQHLPSKQKDEISQNF